MIQKLRAVVWPSVEHELVNAGREGEEIVARARIVLVAIIVAGQVAAVVRRPGDTAAWLAIVVALAFLVLAVFFHRNVREMRPWMGFTAAVLSVSFVSAYIALVFVSGGPAPEPATRAMFALYLLAILTSALRYDGRVATVAGVTTAVQWLALTKWTSASGYLEELTMIAACTVLAHILIRRAGTLRLSSISDNLTGLLNRSHFEERLSSELLRAARYKRTVTVALLDLDAFKQVNDTLGHLAGDRVLREVADRLQASVRRTDLVARFGGDEFAILLPETEGPSAEVKLNEIRAVLDRSIRIRDGLDVTVTSSAGMAVAPADGRDATELLTVADLRLIAAKQSGRNRVVAAAT